MFKSVATTALSITLLLCSAYRTTATVYTVGDTSGWTLGMDYTSWVDGKSFLPGDSLVFNYAAGMHNVVEVNSADYSTCSTTSPLMSDGSGSTTLTLTDGSHYYVCGIPGHCSAGMKITVSVQASSTSGIPPTGGFIVPPSIPSFTSPPSDSGSSPPSGGFMVPPSTPTFTSPPANSGSPPSGDFLVPPSTASFTSPPVNSGCFSSPSTSGTSPFPGTPGGFPAMGATGSFPGLGYGYTVTITAVGLLMLFPLF